MTVILQVLYLRRFCYYKKNQIVNKNNELKVKNEEMYSFFVNSFISDEENYEVLSIVQYQEETPFHAQIHSLCKLIQIYTFF